MSLKPSHWASLVPRNPAEQKPNHYLEMARVAWENRDQLPFAWRILGQGTCDGCALGTTGLRDWTLEGVHLCMVRNALLCREEIDIASHEPDYNTIVSMEKA